MIEYQMEHICSYTAQLEDPPETIGATPEGLRINFYVTGGTVSGPRLNGKVRPVGADWLILRPDGIAVLDVRATFETDDEALVYVRYQGVIDLGENGYEDFLAGNLPARAQIRAAPRFATAHPEYLWLNRVQCINIGEVDFANSEVTYDVYALR